MWIMISNELDIDFIRHTHRLYVVSPRHLTNIYFINSLRPSDAYMCEYNQPTLLQIMAYRLVGTKPLFEPMLWYC